MFQDRVGCCSMGFIVLGSQILPQHANGFGGGLGMKQSLGLGISDLPAPGIPNRPGLKRARRAVHHQGDLFPRLTTRPQLGCLLQQVISGRLKTFHGSIAVSREIGVGRTLHSHRSKSTFVQIHGLGAARESHAMEKNRIEDESR